MAVFSLRPDRIVDMRDLFDDVRAVRDVQGASPEIKHLLLVLMTFCRQDSCWPAVTTLAECLGISVRSTQYRLRQAEEEGWIEHSAENRPNGSQTSNRYFLNFEQVYANQPATPPGPAGPPPGAMGCTPPVTPVAPPRCNGLHPQNYQENYQGKSVVVEATNDSNRQAEDFEQIVRFYSTMPKWAKDSGRTEWISMMQARSLARLPLTWEEVQKIFEDARRSRKSLRCPQAYIIKLAKDIAAEKAST